MIFNLDCVPSLHNFMMGYGLRDDFVQSQKTIQRSRKCRKGADWIIWDCRRGELIVTYVSFPAEIILPDKPTFKSCKIASSHLSQFYLIKLLKLAMPPRWSAALSRQRLKKPWRGWRPLRCPIYLVRRLNPFSDSHEDRGACTHHKLWRIQTSDPSSFQVDKFAKLLWTWSIVIFQQEV